MPIKPILLAFAVALFSQGGYAADSATPASGQPSLATPATTTSGQASRPLGRTPYDIEIVIFERETPTNERWPADPGQPPVNQAVGSLSVPGQSGPDIQVLPAKDDQMGPLVYTLKKHGAIIHAHVRWRQDIPDDQHAHWYQIGDQTMGGVIRVSRGRFIHFNADLLLQRPNGQQPPVRMHLKARMRSGELHYLDHPLGGILIEADRVKPRQPVEPATPTTPTPPPAPETEPSQPPSAPRGSMPRATPDNS